MPALSSDALPAWLAGKDGEDEEKGENAGAETREGSIRGEPTERTALTSSESHDEGLSIEDVVVHRGPVLTFFVAVSAVSIIAALGLGVAHAASLYSFAARTGRESRSFVDVALRAYGLIFCFAICVIELELGPTARSSVVSRFWTLRGVFYALVGLIALDGANDDRREESDDRPASREDNILPYVLYLRSAATAMLSLGVLYFALGLCCCKSFKDRLALDYRKQLAKAQLRAAVKAEFAAKQQRIDAQIDS